MVRVVWLGFPYKHKNRGALNKVVLLVFPSNCNHGIIQKGHTRQAIGVFQAPPSIVLILAVFFLKREATPRMRRNGVANGGCPFAFPLSLGETQGASCSALHFPGGLLPVPRAKHGRSGRE